MDRASSYGIRSDYRSRRGGNVTLDGDARKYWTANRIKRSAYYQYHVYLAAQNIARTEVVESAIDVGCGPATKLGKLIKPFCERVVGVDQDSIIEMCRRMHPELEFHALDFERDQPPETHEGGFDLVICADVIEHMENPDLLLNHIEFYSRPDALVVLSTPEREKIRGSNCLSSPKTEHVREWNQSEFADYISSRNIEILSHEIVPSQQFNWSTAYAKLWLSRFHGRDELRSCQLLIGRAR